jgi:hypothetical protein
MCRIIDSDIADGYRFGIQPAEIANAHPKIKNLFSLRNASKMEIHAYRKRRHVLQWGAVPNDTGKSEVQSECERVLC